jgi:hypothetical protein
MQNTETLLIILAVLQLGDWYTTAKILGSGGRELNPVMRKFMEKVGVHQALFIKSAVIVFAAWYLAPSVMLLQEVIIFYVLIVFHNWHQLP